MSQRQNRRHGGPHGGPGAMMAGEKAKDFTGSARKLAGYLGVHRRKILLVWALAIASTVFSVFGPRLLGQAVDSLLTGVAAQLGGTGGVDFAAVGGLLLWLTGLYVVSAAFGYGQGFWMSGVTTAVSYRLRDDINRKIHRLPFQYFDGTTHGEVLSRITNDVDTIGHTLSQGLTQILSSAAGLLGTLAMMTVISWQLTLVSLVMLPLSAGGAALILKSSQKYFQGQQAYLGHVNGHVEEIFGAHTLVKAFNGERAAAETFQELNAKLYESAWKASFLSGLMMPLSGFVGNLGYVAVVVVGAALVASGATSWGVPLTIGVSIGAFAQYVRQFTQPVSQLAQVTNILQQTAAAAERVFEFLAQPEQTPDAEAAPDAASLDGTIRFDNVGFAYDPGRPVIRDFSAEILPGQKVAIVGPTGAGKTTLMKLLLRFYDVHSGAITIGGQDIRDFKRGELRSLFGLVLQDTWLFGGTVEENIRYGRPDATEEEVRAAAAAAQADHFVRTLPEGYQMRISEEADNLSQGQKQLLTIARAVLADPRFLILDEATSSVDTRTEALIQQAMDRLMEGRTCFVIAHRLSTVRDADRILVLDGGDIVEQGRHEELLAADGFYAKLYNSQFETDDR